MIIKFLLNKKEKEQLALSRVKVPVGHLMYSWLFDGVNGCSCDTCNRAWNLDNDYIRVEDLIEELMRKDNWSIKWLKSKNK